MDNTMIQELQERLALSNAAFNDALNALDPSDPKYFEKLKIVNAMHASIVEDTKAFLNKETEEAKIDVERVRLDSVKEIETEKMAVESHKVETERKSAFWRNVVTGASVAAGLIGTLVAVVVPEVHTDHRFDKSAKFEENDAFLTTTDKETVKDGLRPKKHNLKLF